MAFIKTQKIVRNESGTIISGSASIIDTKYGNYGTYHAKQSVRERLVKGKRTIIRTYDRNHSQVHLTMSMGMVLHTKLLMDFF